MAYAAVQAWDLGEVEVINPSINGSSASNVTSGNRLLLNVQTTNETNVFASITVSNSGTATLSAWTKLVESDFSKNATASISATLWTATVTGTGTCTVTVSYTSGSGLKGELGAKCAEFSGLDGSAGSGCLLTSGTGSNNSTTGGPTGTSASTTTGGELVWACGGDWGSGITFSVGAGLSGFTLQDGSGATLNLTRQAASFAGQAVAIRSAAASTAYGTTGNTGFTWPTNSSQAWSGLIAVIKLAGSSVIANPTAANVTVAALGPTPKVTATAGAANVAAAAYNPTVSTSGNASPTAGVASVTATASTPTPTGTVSAGNANATAAANNPSTAITETVNLAASVTAAAYNPAVSTGSNTTANAGVANVTVAAAGPLAAVTAGAAPTSVTVAASGPTPAQNVTAGTGTATAGAAAPTAAVTPTAGNASVIGAASAAAPQAATFPSAASVTGTAYNPTASAGGNITVNPGIAAVTATAPGPLPLVTFTAGSANVTIVGYLPGTGRTPGAANVTVASPGATPKPTVAAGVAAVAVAAYQPTLHIAGLFTVGFLTASDRVQAVLRAGTNAQTVLTVAAAPQNTDTEGDA